MVVCISSDLLPVLNTVVVDRSIDDGGDGDEERNTLRRQVDPFRGGILKIYLPALN